ncbi:MAG: GtrA family protein [Nakamurella sp.]
MSLVDQVRDLMPPKYREFAKFLVVGGLAWIVDTAIFTVLTNTILTEKVLTCKIISMTISTVLSYILNREWSFDGRGGRTMSREALLFFLFNGIGFAINLAPLATSHYLLGINSQHGYSAFTVTAADWISANIIGTLLGMLFRYWSYRRWVFPEKIEQSTATARPAEPSR